MTREHVSLSTLGQTAYPAAPSCLGQKARVGENFSVVHGICIFLWGESIATLFTKLFVCATHLKPDAKPRPGGVTALRQNNEVT